MLRLLALLPLLPALSAQDTSERPPGLEQIDLANLEAHVGFLEADGREAVDVGSEAQLEVAEYLAEQFAAMGLTPAGSKRGSQKFFQRYGLERRYLIDKSAVTVGDEELAPDYVVVTDGTTKALNLSGDFIFCGTGDQSDLPKSLTGKIPVMIYKKGTQSGRSRSNTPQVVFEMKNRKAKAVVFLVLEEYDDPREGLKTAGIMLHRPTLGYLARGYVKPAAASQRSGRAGRSGGGRGGGGRGGRGGRSRAPAPPPIPNIYLTPTQSMDLLGKLGWSVDESGALKVVGEKVRLKGKVRLQAKLDKRFSAVNVCALLEGADKSDEALIISASLDLGARRSSDPLDLPGPDGSSVAALLEVARVLAEGPTPMRSILFVAFSGSEAGQFGAHHFTEEPIWALPKIAGALHLDQLGVAATGAGSVRIGATPGFSDRSFSSLGRDAHALAKELDLSVTVNSTWTGGDNYFLAQKDVAVAALRGRPGIAKPDEEDASQDESPGYDFEQLAMITRLAYWTGFQAANSESPPTRLGTRTGWDK